MSYCSEECLVKDKPYHKTCTGDPEQLLSPEFPFFILKFKTDSDVYRKYKNDNCALCG